MLVLNLYGGPGTGKSTTAAALFALCKRAGIRCELVTERAKELCYERSPLLANQLYILAAQHRRLTNLQGQVDLAITDGPLGLSHVYASPPFDTAWWHAMVQATNATFDNYNVFLRRLKPYATYGRGQTEEEARQLDKDILASPFIVFNKHLGATNTVEYHLLDIVKEQLALRKRPTPAAKSVPAPTPVAGEWQPWTGGPCPVPPTTIVEVQGRAGRPTIGRACNFPWATRSGPDNQLNITRWRLVFAEPGPSAPWHSWPAENEAVAPHVLVEFQAAGWLDEVLGPVRLDLLRAMAQRGVAVLRWRWTNLASPNTYVTDWQPGYVGPCPVPPESLVEVELRSHMGSKPYLKTAAPNAPWSTTGPEGQPDVRRWRLVPVMVHTPLTGDTVVNQLEAWDWNPWHGAPAGPLPSERTVRVRLRNGVITDPAKVGNLDWEWSQASPGNDIVGWQQA